jgi:hypothetical protein
VGQARLYVALIAIGGVVLALVNPRQRRLPDAGVASLGSIVVALPLAIASVWLGTVLVPDGGALVPGVAAAAVLLGIPAFVFRWATRLTSDQVTADPPSPLIGDPDRRFFLGCLAVPAWFVAAIAAASTVGGGVVGAMSFVVLTVGGPILTLALLRRRFPGGSDEPWQGR